MTRRNGFTLIEVVVALVILGTVVLGLTRFMGNFVHVVATSTTRTVASEVAHEQLERVKVDPSYATLSATWGGTRTGFPDYPAMTRVTTLNRVTSAGPPPRDYTIVTVRVTEPTMTRPVNATAVVARP